MTDSKREEYIDLAIRTEAPITPQLVERMKGHARSIHAIFGLITETGELTDGFKRAIFYGKPLDITNVREELGDFFWYVAILMDEFGFSFEEAMRLNIQKLMARYPAKFTETDALNRNLLNERDVLEDNQFVRRVTAKASPDRGVFVEVDGFDPTFIQADGIATMINSSPSIGKILNRMVEELQKIESPNEEGHGPSQELPGS